METPNVKSCARCKRVLSLDKFSKDRTAKDGLQRMCKSCHGELKALSRKPRKTYEYRFSVPDDFGYWLSGLADGESHFQARVGISKGRKNLQLRFSIGLRLDDLEILQTIHATLGVGRINNHFRWKTQTPLQKHQADYVVGEAAQLQQIIIPLFDKYPLRTKKQREYVLWKQIVQTYGWQGGDRSIFWTGVSRFTDEEWQKIEGLCNELRALRPYSGPE
jgi:hypothetical protein